MSLAVEIFSRRRARVLDILNESKKMAIITPGANLWYLTGYQALALERITALVLSSEANYLITPKLEYNAAVEFFGNDLEVIAWDETENPYSLIRNRHKETKEVLLDEQMSYLHVESIQSQFKNSTFSGLGKIINPLRVVKDSYEIAELLKVSQSISQVHLELRKLKFNGKSEIQIAKEISDLILIEHEQVDFVIVASGPNSANPHHQPNERIIKTGDVVVIDIGGMSKTGYRSDCTRTYHVGAEVDPEFARSYQALQQAQQLGVEKANKSFEAGELDKLVREKLAESDLAKWFIHRLGHGIGLNTHEDPYLVTGNTKRLINGNVFSIEPGFYIPDKWGARIEDIVAIVEGEVINLNDFDHELQIVF